MNLHHELIAPMPPALRVQPAEQRPQFSIEDARACLRHILAFDTGQGTVAECIACRDPASEQRLNALGLGLRWHSHLFVSHNHDPRLLQDTSWTSTALLMIPGATTSQDRRNPGLIVPLAGITATIIPLRPEGE